MRCGHIIDCHQWSGYRMWRYLAGNNGPESFPFLSQTSKLAMLHCVASCIAFLASCIADCVHRVCQGLASSLLSVWKPTLEHEDCDLIILSEYWWDPNEVVAWLSDADPMLSDLIPCHRMLTPCCHQRHSPSRQLEANWYHIKGSWCQ